MSLDTCPHCQKTIDTDFNAEHIIEGCRDSIKTEFIYPPIPDRRFDWQAHRQDYYEGDLIGHGPTEEQAIQDLLALEEC